MKDFVASSKPCKYGGRKGKNERKKNSKHSIYSSKHVRQQQAKSDNSKKKKPSKRKKR